MEEGSIYESVILNTAEIQVTRNKMAGQWKEQEI
jgi:hypothetical protein